MSWCKLAEPSAGPQSVSRVALPSLPARCLLFLDNYSLAVAGWDATVFILQQKQSTRTAAHDGWDVTCKVGDTLFGMSPLSMCICTPVNIVCLPIGKFALKII